MITTSQIVGIIMQGLTPREKEVLMGRFGLEKGNAPQTLAALGAKYGVTRERVRQIEAGALKIAKKNVQNSSELSSLVEKAKKALKDASGVMEKGAFLRYLQGTVSGISEYHASLILEASRGFFMYQADKSFRDFYYLDKNYLKKAQMFLKQWAETLEAKKQHALGGNYSALAADFMKKKGISESHAKNIFEISKGIGTNPYGDMGLSSWPEIRPKTIRDRVYLVLKKRGEPLHFRTIARAINEVKFDAKKASAPTVHNELIKDARFVLVGRGMYGLSEHGYTPGTAKEVIHRILKKNGPLSPRQVILAVQKERFFKPNTVLVNLQNKNFFMRLEDGTYHVSES